MPGITLLGLGPGDSSKLTREAWDILSTIDQVWLRTKQHPCVSGLPPTLRINSFDDLYEEGNSYEEVYSDIVRKIIELGKSPNGVVYAVPGDPFVAEATCREIAHLAKSMGLPIKIISGLSFIEPVFAALDIDPFPHLVLLDAIELSLKHYPVFPPDMPVLVAQLYSRMVAAEVKMTLTTVYPDDHPVCLVHSAGTEEQFIENLPLYEIDRSEHMGLMTVLYVQPLGLGTSFESFQEIVAHLRAPEGCPWDRQQTHLSLRHSLMEESYELIAAIDSGDSLKMTEEFGDLLLQIVLNAQIASEDGEFTMSDVLKGINQKITRRHPHVFGDLELSDVQGALKNWENLKALERADSQEPEKGLLDSIPLTLPALLQAQEYQDRVARVGFDWKEIRGVIEKVSEEIQELKDVDNQEELMAELGDLFFALVNFARWKKIDAESALRQTCRRFSNRFGHLESAARSQGRKLSEMSTEEMDVLWREAKGQKL
jgi:tetrapyrrole methylase family protein/MazG family protein